MNDGNQNHNNKIQQEYPSSTNENGFGELKKRGSLLTLVLVRTFRGGEKRRVSSDKKGRFSIST
jgi:hypothetical protein